MTFDAHDGTFEGRRFPDESEWLESELPADLEISADFVDRTVAAVRAPDADTLANFEAPEPSSDFVDRTMAALQQDRRARWRELLARYVVPEPSREFVDRTLRALDVETMSPEAAPRPSWLRTWTMPLLAAAAVLAVAFLLPREDHVALEVRAADSVPVAFGPAHAASPLPALLTAVDRADDPLALPNTGGDGIWLLLQRRQK